MSCVDWFNIVPVRRDDECETEVEEESIDSPQEVKREGDILR
jgi:hypothetical protein